MTRFQLGLHRELPKLGGVFTPGSHPRNIEGGALRKLNDEGLLATIEIEAPGERCESYSLPAGQTVLIGREPESRRLLEQLPPGTTLVLKKLDSPSVSANHAIVWQSPNGTLGVRDLSSRNGSWLRLPADSEVVVGSARSVTLCVGGARFASEHDDGPPDAAWSDAEHFPEAIAKVVANWLRGHQIPVRVSITRETGTASKHLSRIMLTKDSHLCLESDETLGLEWPASLGAIYRFVERQRTLLEAEREANHSGLVTVESPLMRSALRTVISAAQGGARCMLITGPTGSGKEGLARAFHRYSGRSGAMVARNCAMLSKDFLRAELFGTEAGAYTDSVRRLGAVERAQGGTLFLDEVGEMPLEVQAMLLRFLDSSEFERMGDYGNPRRADVMLVCATNRDLRAECHEGRFRSDLWYRLSAHTVDVPPLSRRYGDLVAFLERSPLAGHVNAWTALTPDAASLLTAHPWEGNFRELKSFVARIPFSTCVASIDVETCRRWLGQVALTPSNPAPEPAPVASEAPLGDKDRWGQLVGQALDAYSEDTQLAAPRTWEEFKEYVEKYFKPLVLVHLGGCHGSGSGATVDVQEVARRIEADRGTVLKQMRRYFERYGSSEQP